MASTYIVCMLNTCLSCCLCKLYRPCCIHYSPSMSFLCYSGSLDINMPYQWSSEVLFLLFEGPNNRKERLDSSRQQKTTEKQGNSSCKNITPRLGQDVFLPRKPRHTCWVPRRPGFISPSIIHTPAPLWEHVLSLWRYSLSASQAVQWKCRAVVETYSMWGTKENRMGFCWQCTMHRSCGIVCSGECRKRKRCANIGTV